ncbi:hypothetical protein [Nocardia brasiliensis]|uniref:hypothetical protein n=1 Tax=Nocardia brasiliensis TaxID=37326 RepID=UPI0011DD41F4|nr:hypothetical protein [Nocardia brasiliensis]
MPGDHVPLPDLDRLGGLRWVERTRGVLTWREQRQFLGAATKMMATALSGRMRLAIRGASNDASTLETVDFRPPDSKFAREVMKACAEQSPTVSAHSYRTWIFGSALSAIDATPMDSELFFGAALLHDHGIEQPVPGEDFTLRSAARARSCAHVVGLPERSAVALADAITAHFMPDLTSDRDGALATYVSQGAMLDLAGLRAEKLTRDFRAKVARAYPRDRSVANEIALIRKESRLNPRSRMGLAYRLGMTTALRLSPMRRD